MARFGFLALRCGCGLLFVLGVCRVGFLACYLGSGVLCVFGFGLVVSGVF